MTHKNPNKPRDTASHKISMTRRQLLGTAVASGAIASVTPIKGMAQATAQKVDVMLIGGGIMSATLGVLLKELEPDWNIELIERLDQVAEESSNGWNNAGTGHSALCEMNYTPETENGEIDITKAVAINEQWQITRQFLAHQLRRGVLDTPRNFLNSTPHMSFVWGDTNIEYLRKRHAALLKSPLFAGMKFSTDHDEIAQWTPLMMQGANLEQKVAATWHPLGTDANWGEVTRQYATHLDAMDGFTTTTGREVTGLERTEDGGWRVFHEPTDGGREEATEARFVFIGAGGAALPLLQDSGIPEAEAYGGFPVGGAFLICENPDVVGRHAVKTYGKAASGNPPMSVPHLDRRFLDGKETLLFGPFATFSTKFLKHGSLWDLPSSMTLHNFIPMMQVGIHRFELVEYLAGQLMQDNDDRMEQLRAYVPDAKDEDWRFWKAGQRVQIIKNTEDGGKLKLGTETVVSEDKTLTALLGASPGASTAAPIMLDLIAKAFPEQVAGKWAETLAEIVPTYGLQLNDHPDLLEQEWAATGEVLQLALPAPKIDRSLLGDSAVEGAGEATPRMEL